MRRVLFFAIWGGLSACTGKTGEGPSGDGLTVSDMLVGGCGASDARANGPDSSDTGGPESLTVTAAGAGTITVSHQNYTDECCLEHDVETATSGTTLTISYPPKGDPCDCVCGYDFDFTVSGLEAGSWTVNAGGATASVVVD